MKTKQKILAILFTFIFVFTPFLATAQQKTQEDLQKEYVVALQQVIELLKKQVEYLVAQLEFVNRQNQNQIATSTPQIAVQPVEIKKTVIEIVDPKIVTDVNVSTPQFGGVINTVEPVVEVKLADTEWVRTRLEETVVDYKFINRTDNPVDIKEVRVKITPKTIKNEHKQIVISSRYDNGNPAGPVLIVDKPLKEEIYTLPINISARKNNTTYFYFEVNAKDTSNPNDRYMIDLVF